MTKSIRQIIIFSSILLAMSFLLSLFYNHVVMKDSLINRTEREIKKTENIRILFLGDSKILRGVDPRYIPGSFNYTSTGESYLQSYIKLKDLFKKRPGEIEYVILPLDLHSFSAHRVDRFHKDFFWVYKTNFLKLGMELGRPLKYLYLFTKANLFSYRGKTEDFFYFLENNPPSEMHRGFYPSDAPFVEEENRVKKMFGKKKAIAKQILKYFDKTIKLAQDNGAKVILVKYPVYKDYYNEVTSLIDIEQFKQTVNKILEKYPNIQILDYQKLIFDDKTKYFNSNHLNASGADLLSKKLKEDLKSIYE